VGSVGAKVAGVGLPAVSLSSGEMWAAGGGGPARVGGIMESRSTSRSRATRLEPRFRRTRSENLGSTVRSSGGANGAWCWYSGEQGLGVAILWVQRKGEVELSMTQWREARPGQGRGKGTASLVRHGSAIGNRRPHGMGEFGAGEGDLATDWSGLLGRCPLAACGQQASPAMWPTAAVPRWDRIGWGREERGREREKGQDSN
jgi:hypothetical protein